MLSPSKRAALIDPSADRFATKASAVQRTLYARAAALAADRKANDQGPATPEWRVRKWNAEERLITETAEMLQAARDAVQTAHKATKGSASALEALTKVAGTDAALLLDEANRWKRLYHERGEDVARAEEARATAEGEVLAMTARLIAAGLWAAYCQSQNPQ